MKRRLAAGAIVCVAVLALLWLGRLWNTPHRTSREADLVSLTSTQSFQTPRSYSTGLYSANTLSNTPQSTINTPAPPQVSRSTASAPAIPYTLGSPEGPPPNLEPATVLENMRTAIRSYGSMFHENPIGTNPEIAAALNGGNPKEVKFIDEQFGLRIDGNGELVDYWGTPFFFHQLSATEMEIRSAGPDRRMWTSDDLLIK